MNYILLILIVIGAGLFLYWLLVMTEGVYLGRRVVVWLYDLTANKYDGIKQFDVDHERATISIPLSRTLAGLQKPLVLDVATGTGRVPVLLMQEAGFAGHVVGLDAAGKMLAIASSKLGALPVENGYRAAFIQQTAVPLPFPSNIFDAVTCLEALEFFPSDEAALSEMVRVLRPGGVLMTTRRKGYEARMFVDRYRSVESFEALLRDTGLASVKTDIWQINYDLVTARKRSIS